MQDGPLRPDREWWERIASSYDECRSLKNWQAWARVQRLAQWFAVSRWATRLFPYTSMGSLRASRSGEHQDRINFPQLVIAPTDDGKLNLTLFGPQARTILRSENVTEDSDAIQIANQMAAEL